MKKWGAIWTQQERAFIKKAYLEDGKTMKQIASLLKDRTPIAVKAQLNYLGVKLPQGEAGKRLQEGHAKRIAPIKRIWKGYSIYSVTAIAVIAGRKKTLRRQKKISLAEILEDICDVFSQDVDTVLSKSRKGEIVFCRQLYCYIAKRMHPNKSLVDIGKQIGRDHTTVIHCIQKIKDGLKSLDPLFMQDWLYYLEHTKVFKK